MSAADVVKLVGCLCKRQRRGCLCFGTIQRAIGPREDLPTIVKARKLQWYGHGPRSSGLAKTILQGTVKEARRQGSQKKR